MGDVSYDAEISLFKPLRNKAASHGATNGSHAQLTE